MFSFENLWRWCDDYGGGLVIAETKDEAKEKLEKMYGENRNVENVVLWRWTSDDYYDEQNPDVLDIYS